MNRCPAGLETIMKYFDFRIFMEFLPTFFYEPSVGVSPFTLGLSLDVSLHNLP